MTSGAEPDEPVAGSVLGIETGDVGRDRGLARDRGGLRRRRDASSAAAAAAAAACS